MKAKNERIDAAKDKILRRANEEAHEIIQKAKDTADESIPQVQQVDERFRHDKRNGKRACKPA